MNTVGEKIDLEKAVCRTMDIEFLHKVVSQTNRMARSATWGFHNACVTVKDQAYRFTVNGHHHKGHVHIVLNFMDLFDVYYTSNRGTIKKIDKDVYLEDLVDTLDISIERIKDYVV